MSRDYREKTIKGLYSNAMGMTPSNVTVRMTNDKRGASLSLQANACMIHIPLEAVKDIIQITPKEHNK